jgi:hypothetical protein
MTQFPNIGDQIYQAMVVQSLFYTDFGRGADDPGEFQALN